MTIAAWITLVATIIVGSTGSGGVVYWLLNRNSQRVVDARIESERESFEANTAEKWQKIIDEGATRAYAQVERRCQKCEEDMERMLSIFMSIISPLASFVQHASNLDEVDQDLLSDAIVAISVGRSEIKKHS